MVSLAFVQICVKTQLHQPTKIPPSRWFASKPQKYPNASFDMSSNISNTSLATPAFDSSTSPMRKVDNGGEKTAKKSNHENSGD